jgi:LPXTG-motif cell wall-anchored protein
VQAALGVQYGDDSAAVDESIAGAADELGITQNQVNACLGEVSDVNQGEDAVGDVVIDGGTVVAVEDGSASAASEGSASAASEGSASASAAAATETLPETGGASLLALGAGALLVAGGLLARRIVR